ncbi:hypothetical protein ACFOHS_15730 [Jhaorihella thermophila]
MPMRPEAIMVAALLAGAAQAGPLFAPQPAPAHSYDGGWEHFVGGGVAVFDCNGDRLPELFVAGGSNPAQLLVNRSPVGARCASTRPPRRRWRSPASPAPIRWTSTATGISIS